LGNYNSIVGNNISGSERAIFLWSSMNNTIIANNITNNDYGIIVSRTVNPGPDSSDNKIFHNNFRGNTQNVRIDIYEGVNYWDNGYPSGGNYWSDYTGVDSNHDGIGDTSYIIDSNNRDRFPLMKPYIVPEYPLVILLLFMTVTLFVFIFYKRKHLI